MTGRMLTVCGLIVALSAPGLAAAGEVRLSIKDGRVTLAARDATLREILVEWERVGGTRIVNRDRVPGTRLTLELANVTEEQALTTLLRPIAGYMASRRLGPEGGASAFSRIILMPALATPAASLTAAAPSTARHERPAGPGHAARSPGHAAARPARRPGCDGDGRAGRSRRSGASAWHGAWHDAPAVQCASAAAGRGRERRAAAGCTAGPGLADGSSPRPRCR